MMGGTVHGDERRERFEAAFAKYIDFYLEHMRIEETQILPLAERVLTADDWSELDAAFLANRDPNLWFGLLTDFCDAEQEHVESDEPLLALAVVKLQL